jgi:hypothetical protein
MATRQAQLHVIRAASCHGRRSCAARLARHLHLEPFHFAHDGIFWSCSLEDEAHVDRRLLILESTQSAHPGGKPDDHQRVRDRECRAQYVGPVTRNAYLLRATDQRTSGLEE